ncbi:MAG: leucyl aminopeptidase family protein [Prolixibacteraceae bacterium]|nr:leucyl aminopeptidase family protein [Prolixibacteraceae bacterium]
MKTQILKISELKETISTAIILKESDNLPKGLFKSNELAFLKKRLKEEQEITIFRYPELIFIYKIEDENNQSFALEKARKAGARLFQILKKEKTGIIQIWNKSGEKPLLAFTEGLLLASYSFSKYKKEKDSFELKKILVLDENVKNKELKELSVITEAVFFARDLVNEPLSTLTAEKLAKEIQIAGGKAGFSVEVFEKQKIKALKMGGLLAVNRGSIDPPTFSVLEWKPEKPANKKPIILVGKGVVYDTGGLSLKPTFNSMDYMKSDMGGAAAVTAVICALAKAEIPVHVIALIPATDNRPGANAFTPGDVITMFDGTTVEIKNTDAEGRLLLADALAYAKKYDPELVIDVATLTGSAVLITGDEGMAVMGNNRQYIEKLKISGEDVYERLVELPLWEEFSEPLKSSVADMNNLGTREGQTSIAGKFLEHFTEYKWIHIDIAGPAFIHEDKTYRIKGGTGSGTRLLFNFFKNLFPKK